MFIISNIIIINEHDMMNMNTHLLTQSSTKKEKKQKNSTKKQQYTA